MNQGQRGVVLLHLALQEDAIVFFLNSPRTNPSREEKENVLSLWKTGLTGNQSIFASLPYATIHHHKRLRGIYEEALLEWVEVQMRTLHSFSGATMRALEALLSEIRHQRAFYKKVDLEEMEKEGSVFPGSYVEDLWKSCQQDI